jgi:DNA mismatch endonuclease (patch repair protein)
VADTVDAATRSRIMRAIKGRDTGPERRLCEALAFVGVDPAVQCGDLPGRPDFCVGRLVVFVHGCFWHGCRRHYRAPRTRRAFWRRKVDGNRRRDRRVRRALNRLGLSVMVIWEHENPKTAAARVLRRQASRCAR